MKWLPIVCILFICILILFICILFVFRTKQHCLYEAQPKTLIKRVYYINLDRRRDRRSQVENELFNVMGFSRDMVERVQAIDDPEHGYVGCAKSHLKVVNLIKDSGLQGNVLILEDDFKFKVDRETFYQSILHLMEMDPEYKVCQLSYNMNTKGARFLSDRLFEADRSMTASGYMVSTTAIDDIHACYTRAVDKVSRSLDQSDSIDVAWFELQGSGKHFYGFYPRIGFQRESYSDIQKGNVKYELFQNPGHGIITCPLLGGLGNQLFQVGTVLACAHKMGLTMAFSDQQQMHPLMKGRLPLMNANDLDASISYEYTQPSFTYEDIPDLRYHNGIRLHGSFQSHKYIASARRDLIDLFGFGHWHPPSDGQAYVALHVRRGDYLLYPDIHPTMPPEYYHNALAEVRARSMRPLRVFVFSDDIDWCKQNLIIDNVVFITGNPDYVDLMLMSGMHHNIISNSTFSWFGAYLNDNPHKVIVAPRTWFGPKGPKWSEHDLIPDDWILL